MWPVWRRPAPVMRSGQRKAAWPAGAGLAAGQGPGPRARGRSGLPLQKSGRAARSLTSTGSCLLHPVGCAAHTQPRRGLPWLPSPQATRGTRGMGKVYFLRGAGGGLPAALLLPAPGPGPDLTWDAQLSERLGDGPALCSPVHAECACLLAI